MRKLLWITVALICTGAAVLIDAWPDLHALRMGRISQVTLAETEADLQGIRVTIADQVAAILPDRPDRAVIYLRLALQGDPQVMRDWRACDVSLRGDDGRRWLPLGEPSSGDVVTLLAAGAEAGQTCGQSLIFAEDAQSPSLSDMVFLVPSDRLDGLRLLVTGIALRPEAVSLSLRPALRPL